jgi:membrane dipeptidase
MAGICVQVFASWVWSEKYRGRELETGLAKVEAVRQLCEEHADELFLARTGPEIAEACRRAADAELLAEAERAAKAARSAGEDDNRGDGFAEERLAEEREAARRRPRTAIVAGLESADPLQGDVDNLAVFYDAGVRLITLAWGDNSFLGSTYGNNGPLTDRGADLVTACEERGVIVDVSHASDAAFNRICQVAQRPFIASHSNCRELCPSPRNLNDDMIRALAERGGVMGITLAPGFLSADYLRQEAPLNDRFKEALLSGDEEAMGEYIKAIAGIPRPPLDLVVQHVRHAINIGGEDAVGLGGDLDGVEALPDGFAGVSDYPRIITLLRDAGLKPVQIDKVCYGNLARLFKEGLE